MKPNHTYLLLFLVSICSYSSLLCQQNLPSAKIARRAITIDAFTTATNGNSINWHQPILVLKGKSNGNANKEKGYLNGSIGLGRSFFPQPGICIPHSVTFNIRIQADKNNASFMEMGYGGLGWRPTSDDYSYNGKRYGIKYGGGLLLGYRINGPIRSKKTFVFRVSSTLMVHKELAFGEFFNLCLAETCEEATIAKNRLVVLPLINVSFGIGL
jgi:hypothetical protein